MHVHRSNRIERLVDGLAEVVGAPLTDPCARECIVVQGRGMERWLAMQLARRLGVWANPDFPFPRRVLQRAVAAVLGEAAAPTPAFEPEQLLWELAALLPALLARPAFAPLARYLDGDREAVRRLQLAAHIAATFDRYVVYRPALLREWDRGQGGDWQAELWRALVQRHGRGHLAARLRRQASLRGDTSAGTLPVLAHGTPDQIERMVPPLAQGHELAAFALTEPGSGSDASAMRARYDPATGTVTGTKQWITNGSYARHVNVFAREGERVSAFVVRDFQAAREEEKLGLHSSSTADLVFEASPAERLGPEGGGMRVALSTLDGGRIGIAAQAVGIAQAALDLAAGYAKERNAFGKPIGGFQAISQRLADMQTEIEAARALVWRAARLKQAGRPHTVEGAQAKLFASRVARHWTGEAIQVLGGYGYTREFPAERYYRDAKVTEIYEGTSEIQRLVIARALLGAIAG